MMTAIKVQNNPRIGIRQKLVTTRSALCAGGTEQSPFRDFLTFQDHVSHSKVGGVGDGERDQFHSELFSDAGGLAVQF
jgi:hypothetical protein